MCTYGMPPSGVDKHPRVHPVRIRRKNIRLICRVTLVLSCSIHLNIYVGLFRLFCILLLNMYVSHCNLIIVWCVLLFPLLDMHVLPKGISVPLALLSQWIRHNTGIFQQYSGFVFDYFYPIIQLVFSCSASCYYFHG